MNTHLATEAALKPHSEELQTSEDAKNQELNKDVAMGDDLAPGSRSSEDNDDDKDLEKNDIPSSHAVAASPNAQDCLDPNVVFWKEPADQDPENPLNWSSKKKWTNIGILSATTFLTPFASSMFAPGVPQVMQEFQSSSSELATFVVSVYVLGFAIGPLFIAPLSEMYGRLLLYNVSNVFFIGFTIGCAESTSMGMLIAFRFLAGCVGSASITIGGGTIADMFPLEQRGGVLALYALGPLLGPVIAPVIGGFLTQARGWRWVFWLITIYAGVVTIATFLFMKETYAPVLLEAKTKRLRKETNNPQLRSKLSTNFSHRSRLLTAIIRPSKMLFLSPIVTMLALYMAMAYGILYLLFTTFPFVFEEQYGFSSGIVGLTYIPLGIGMLTGLGIMGFLSDRIIKRVKAKGTTVIPEHRLPVYLSIPAGVALPIGLFIYGWTADRHTHWIAPLLGTALVGLSMIAIFMLVQTYLIDAYTLHAASAVAAVTVLRSLVGALLPLCGLRMYDVLGLGWGNSLLAFISLALVPVPVVFRFYGEKIRAKFAVKL